MSADLPAFSRPETTGAVTRGAARLMASLGWAPIFEAPLPNGRRADILAVSPKGQFAIVEVKSCLEDYRCDQKWGDYAPFCDAFYFAVSPDFPQEILCEGVGLMVCDGFGGAVLVEPERQALAPARRKALLLDFGLADDGTGDGGADLGELRRGGSTGHEEVVCAGHAVCFSLLCDERCDGG